MQQFKQKKALIIGINSQDGFYLSSKLSKLGYEVFGTVKDASENSRKIIKKSPIYLDIHISELNLENQNAIKTCLMNIFPDEIYYLAAQSYPTTSWERPIQTFQINTISLISILDFIRTKNSKIKMFYASSGEVYDTKNTISENSQINFISPYGVSKYAAQSLIGLYRKNYALHLTVGVLFNHDSPLRSEDFILKKITATLKRIAGGSSEVLRIGNKDIKRSWGFAGDFAEAMIQINNYEIADDFIVSSDNLFTLEDIINLCSEKLNLKIKWNYDGVYPFAINADNKKIIIQIDKSFFRKMDKSFCNIETNKIQHELNWQPATDIDTLMHIMLFDENIKNYES